MRFGSMNPAEELEELRRLLLSREQQELSKLKDRLGDKQLRAREVATALPQAIKISRAQGDELTGALQPSVEAAVRQSIAANPQMFVDALHPILGRIMRRWIAESFRRRSQSFSPREIKWRLEAWRTGKSFAEFSTLRSLVYRVEQLFLVHRETSLPLLHVAADRASTQDSVLAPRMLSAIRDFARDSFRTGPDGAVEEFRIGNLQVWIAPGREAYLAAVIRGTPPRELRAKLEEAIEGIHVLHDAALASFKGGDTSSFERARPELEACLRSQSRATESAAGKTRGWLILGTLAIVIAVVGFGEYRGARHWRELVRRLNAEPGIAVTNADRHWFSQSRIAGLRDPVSADPATIARGAGFDASRIAFDWKEYLALDSAIVLRRFTDHFGAVKEAQVTIENGVVKITGAVPNEWIERVRRAATQVPGVNALDEQDVAITYDPTLALEQFKAQFPLPASVRAAVADNTLRLSGAAPYEWIAAIREGATKIPGINAINGDDLVVQFDPKLVLQRFQMRFGLPESVNASMQGSRLVLAGEASHAWLDRVRRGALEVPGVRALDDLKVEDIDQRTFQQAKATIENAAINFAVNKDNLAPESSAVLARLPDEIQRCFAAAQRMGANVSLEVRGYAEAAGTEAGSVDLSRRRAETVRNFLISRGLDAAKMKSLGIGAPQLPTAGEPPAPEQPDRRVSLRVTIQP